MYSRQQELASHSKVSPNTLYDLASALERQRGPILTDGRGRLFDPEERQILKLAAKLMKDKEVRGVDMAIDRAIMIIGMCGAQVEESNCTLDLKLRTAFKEFLFTRPDFLPSATARLYIGLETFLDLVTAETENVPAPPAQDSHAEEGGGEQVEPAVAKSGEMPGSLDDGLNDDQGEPACAGDEAEEQGSTVLPGPPVHVSGGQSQLPVVQAGLDAAGMEVCGSPVSSTEPVDAEARVEALAGGDDAFTAPPVSIEATVNKIVDRNSAFTEHDFIRLTGKFIEIEKRVVRQAGDLSPDEIQFYSGFKILLRDKQLGFERYMMLIHSSEIRDVVATLGILVPESGGTAQRIGDLLNDFQLKSPENEIRVTEQSEDLSKAIKLLASESQHWKPALECAVVDLAKRLR